MIYENVTNMKKLEQSIAALEDRRKIEWLEIKATTDEVAESLKPANMAKQALAEFMADRDIAKILKTVTSLGAGALVHQVTVKNTSNTFLRFAGRVLQISVTNMINRILKR